MPAVSNTLRRVLIVVALAAAAALLVWVYNNAVVGDDQASEAGAEGVDRFIPASGAEVLAQSTVGVDLADGYDADLEINGVRITDVAENPDADGLRKNLSVGLVEYVPGPGKRIEALRSERNCVVANVWLQEDGPATAKPVRWCFDAA